ncbi:MAG TPA: DUF3574 domain-containing protein [Alphaproteobacteria bacterium]|nr:DUF3574 domain-containing protein [Alphaproteobacteria bacterium]
MRMRAALSGLGVLLLVLAACAAPQPMGEAMIATRLYFGMSMPGGGTVGEAAWREFVEAEVTPRFPDGLTVLAAHGQWRDRTSGRIVRERSRVLVLLHRGTAKATNAITTIIARYKSRFHQQSVLRIDTPVRAQF